MPSVLQAATILSICWLIRGAPKHPNHDEVKSLYNKHSNQNGPGIGDFYFDEQKTNDYDVKTGRTIDQSAGSKKGEQTHLVENKTGALFSDEFGFKNALSYILNMIDELKKDIFGIKEMASLENAKNFTNSQDSPEDKIKQNKIGESNDTPKPEASTKNPEFEKQKQQPKSNYITDYYQNNGMKFVDEDPETSSDESDDSSHKPNDEDRVHEVSQNKDIKCISELLKMERKPYSYSSEAEENKTSLMSRSKIPEESDKKLDEITKSKNFKESTTNTSKMKQNNLKTSGDETENIATASSNSKKEKCMKKNTDASKDLNQQNEATEKPLELALHVTTRSPRNQNLDGAKSKRPNQNRTTGNLSKKTSPSSDSRNSVENLENKRGSDLTNISGVVEQSTTLSSQSSKDIIYPENLENEPFAFGMSTEKPVYKKQQVQITSLKPEDQIQARNNAESFRNKDAENKYSNLFLKSHEAGSKIRNREMSTDTQIKDGTKESKSERLTVSFSQTTAIYSENKPELKKDGQLTYNSLVTGSAVSPTSSENIMKAYNLNKDTLNNQNSKEGRNENEKLNAANQSKNNSETQRYSETEKTKAKQLNINSKPEKLIKDNKLNNSKAENSNIEEDDNVDPTTTNDFQSPKDSYRELQNHDVEGPSEPQKQKNTERINVKREMLKISSDYEYEDNEYLDISDELTDMETDDDLYENQEEDELITNTTTGENNEEVNLGNTATGENNKEVNLGNTATGENNKEVNLDNATTVFKDESQISQHTGYIMEEKSQEQYNTFLEYFYKHSNNPLFQSLKNQSNTFSQ